MFAVVRYHLLLVQPCSSTRPKMPLTYVVYVCSVIAPSKGLLWSKGRKHLKQSDMTEHSIFKWQTPHFHAYFIHMRWQNKLDFLNWKSVLSLICQYFTFLKNSNLFSQNLIQTVPSRNRSKWGVSVENASFGDFKQNQRLWNVSWY